SLWCRSARPSHLRERARRDSVYRDRCRRRAGLARQPHQSHRSVSPRRVSRAEGEAALKCFVLIVHASFLHAYTLGRIGPACTLLDLGPDRSRSEDGSNVAPRPTIVTETTSSGVPSVP